MFKVEKSASNGVFSAENRIMLGGRPLISWSFLQLNTYRTSKEWHSSMHAGSIVKFEFCKYNFVKLGKNYGSFWKKLDGSLLTSILDLSGDKLWKPSRFCIESGGYFMAVPSKSNIFSLCIGANISGNISRPLQFRRLRYSKDGNFMPPGRILSKVHSSAQNRWRLCKYPTESLISIKFVHSQTHNSVRFGKPGMSGIRLMLLQPLRIKCLKTFEFVLNVV